MLRLPARPAAPSGAFLNKADLKAAVDDHPASEAAQGAVSGWDVSRVDDLSELFEGRAAATSAPGLPTAFRYASFNADIGALGHGGRLDHGDMFGGGRSFNLGDWDVGGWDVYMFSDSSFNQGRLRGDVSIGGHLIFSDSDISGVGYGRPPRRCPRCSIGAIAFNVAIGGWDVASVTNLQNIFNYANAFNQQLRRPRWIADPRWEAHVATWDIRVRPVDDFNRPGDIGAWDTEARASGLQPGDGRSSRTPKSASAAT